MDICIVTVQADISGILGGVSTHVNELSNILTKLGHRVAVICPSHPDYPQHDHSKIVDDILYLCLGNISPKTNSSHWNRAIVHAFTRLSETYNFQIVFSEGIAAQGILRSSLFNNIPFYCFLHNFGVTHFYNILKEVNNFTSLLYYFHITIPRLILKIFKDEIPTYKACSLLLSCSAHNAKRVRTFYRIKENKIFVIPNWVNTEQFAPNPALRKVGRKQWNIQRKQFVFLLVGSLYLPKGFQIAIKSFRRYLETGGDGILIIAGSGRHENSLKQLVSKLGFLDEQHIRFLGEIHRSKLPMLYNSADIFLIPSLFIEVLPYTLVEAMSCGLPFIGSNLGGITEAAGDVGVLVPPGDHMALTRAMTNLAQDSDRCTNLGLRARKRAKKFFSQEAVYPVIHQLLESISSLNSVYRYQQWKDIL